MQFFIWLSLFTKTGTPPHEYVPSALSFTESDIAALTQKLQLLAGNSQSAPAVHRSHSTISVRFCLTALQG